MAFRMVLTSPKGAKGMVAQAKVAREAALKVAGEYWARELLGEHFTAGAEKKYGYVKRTDRHLRRKRREGRGEDPNVYTGQLEQKLMSTKPSITVNRRGVVLVWRGLPRYTFVVDTMEFVKADARWNDETFKRMRAAAGSGEKEQEKVEKAIAGILRWRREHPQDANGKFKRVKRPDKVKEISAFNRADADAVGRVFKDAFTDALKGIDN